jgi:hypothetical protein
MKFKIVSGYIPIEGLRNATPTVFRQRGEGLKRAVSGFPAKFFEGFHLEDCWAHEYIVNLHRPRPIEPYTHSDEDRFPTREHHLLSCIIMHQKQEWMCLAAIEDPEPDVFVCIDYGVLKQHEMSEEVIARFCQRLANRSRMPICEAPGIRQQQPVDADEKSWDRFCGSVVLEPRSQLFDLSRAMKQWSMHDIERSGKINIESNVLAHMENSGFPFRWYAAGWGRPMFDNLPED